MGHVSTKTNQHVKYESSVINSSQDNEQKPYFTLFTCDPDLKPSESKINRVHVLNKTDQHVTYDNERKPFFTKRTIANLTFELVNPKKIQIMFSTRPISM